MNRRNTLFGLACCLLAPAILLAVPHERPWANCKNCKKCGRLCKCDCKNGCKCKPGCCKTNQSPTFKPEPKLQQGRPSTGPSRHYGSWQRPSRDRGRNPHPQHRERSGSEPSRSRGPSESNRHLHHRGNHIHRGTGGVCPECKRKHDAKSRQRREEEGFRSEVDKEVQRGSSGILRNSVSKEKEKRQWIDEIF